MLKKISHKAPYSGRIIVGSTPFRISPLSIKQNDLLEPSYLRAVCNMYTIFMVKKSITVKLLRYYYNRCNGIMPLVAGNQIRPGLSRVRGMFRAIRV